MSGSTTRNDTMGSIFRFALTDKSRNLWSTVRYPLCSQPERPKFSYTGEFNADKQITLQILSHFSAVPAGMVQ